MRFSPTLLACCTISAAAVLPARAELSPSAPIREAVPAAIAPAQQPAIPSPAPTVAAPPAPAFASANQTPAPAALAQAAESSQERLERLRDGIGNPPAPADSAEPAPSAPPETTPETTPETAPDPSQPTPEAAEPPEEVRVLVAEVNVASVDAEPLPPELVDRVFEAVDTQPGRTTTRSQLQADINSVFATGFFANVQAIPEDTPLGVRVTFLVDPNPVLTEVQVRDNQVLPEAIVDEIFREQYGQILNLRDFQDGILELNEWYQDNGYVLAQVATAPQVSESGVVTLIVAEGVIEEIEVRFINEEGDSVDENGNPIRGRTRDFIVTREFETQPGDVFQQQQIQQDLQRVFGLGIFDDIRLSLDPGDEDPRKVKVVVNIDERNSGSIGAAAGFNLRGDIFGSVSYSQDNFGGNNQKLRAEVQLSSSELLFDLSFTDPWIAGDPNRTAYTVNLFNRRSRSLIFDGGDIEVNLPNGDTPRINRLGGGVTFSRPLSDSVSASLGLEYQRVAVLDEGGRVTPRDRLGNRLSFSDSGRDDLLTIPFGLVWDQRNDPTVPTSGSLLRFGTEQSIPVGNGSLFFNRLRASYSYYIPVNFLGFGDGPQALAFNVQTGTVLGDLPPYEAFSLGGTNSVRGYEEGELGTGRTFIQATAEYRFPLFSNFLGGTLFLDFGTDLGSGDSILGDPAGVRGKPGTGFGYGAGVRVQTPLGALRLDYGFNDQGDSRIHFGIGERF